MTTDEIMALADAYATRRQHAHYKSEVETRQALHAAIEKLATDAERYRWLRDESWAGYNISKGMPSVYTVDCSGNRKMMLAEEAMDDAIDAARSKQ